MKLRVLENICDELTVLSPHHDGCGWRIQAEFPDGVVELSTGYADSEKTANFICTQIARKRGSRVARVLH